MNEKQVLAFDVTIKAVNEEDNSVTAVFSHKSRDRAGDVLPPEVLMAGAENFLKNPVLLDSHDYKGVENIIGKVEDLKVSGGGLTGRAVYFTGKGNEAADWAYTLAKEGLAAFSVGFRALDYDYIKEKDANGYEIVTGYQFKKVELLEISQVSVPCNPRALKKIFAPQDPKAPAACAPKAESAEEQKAEREKIAKAFKEALAETYEVTND